MVVVKREAGAAESPWDFYRLCASQDPVEEIRLISERRADSAGCTAFNRALSAVDNGMWLKW